MAEKQGILGTITKIIFIGGAIILFALLAYLIIKWIPKAINGVAGIGSGITKTLNGGDQIKIIANEKEINSGETFSLSWEYTPEKPGEYFMTYSCEDSLLFDIQSVNGQKRIICETPFKLGENVGQIFLIPTLGKQNIFVDSTIKVFYKDFAEKKEVAKGLSVLTLKNVDGSETADNPYDANLAGSTVTTEPTESIFSTPDAPRVPQIGGNTVAPQYYGKADLQISNVINNGNSGLSFTVYNRGTAYTGNWYFSYTDAENPTRTMTSPLQMSLGPNQGLFTTVRFDGQRYDSQAITIYLDSTNAVAESVETNNIGSVTIYGYGNNNNNYYYNNYDDDDEADLVTIEDLEVGYMRGSRFYEDDTIDENDEAGVRFTVRNRGGESTGRWEFEITNTPYDDDDDYESRTQSSLRPGEEKTFTVEFDNIDEGSYNIRVEVDSDDDVDEENERNNTESERLRVRD